MFSSVDPSLAAAKMRPKIRTDSFQWFFSITDGFLYAFSGSKLPLYCWVSEEKNFWKQLYIFKKLSIPWPTPFKKLWVYTTFTLWSASSHWFLGICHFSTKILKIKIDDTYYFVQAHEVQSILYNSGRYYSSYFLRVLISLGKVS